MSFFFVPISARQSLNGQVSGQYILRSYESCIGQLVQTWWCYALNASVEFLSSSSVLCIFPCPITQESPLPMRRGIAFRRRGNQEHRGRLVHQYDQLLDDLEKYIQACAKDCDPRSLLLLANSTGGRNTLETTQAEGVLQMKRRPRIYYTESQKALMWERWLKGESLQQIAQLFDRNHSSIERRIQV